MRKFREVSILIVDDDCVQTEAMLREFQRLSNPIFTAEDGEQALTMLRNRTVPPPYLILLDIYLPKLSGIEFLKSLRADNSLKQAIVFVLSIADDPEIKRQAYQYNIAGFINKNSISKDFNEVISMCKQYGKLIEFPQ